MKSFREEIAGSSTTTTSIDKVPVVKKKKRELPKADEEIIGGHCFQCDSTTFNAAIQGRNKFARWDKFLNQNQELASRIKTFKRSFPKKIILLQNKSTGEYMFANKALGFK